MADLKAVVESITPEEVMGIVSGVPFKYKELLPQQQSELRKAAIHCCANGPVSVHKETQIPGIDRKCSIEQIVGHRISNSQWAGFCQPFAEKIHKMDLDLPWVRQTGMPWPLGQRDED